MESPHIAVRLYRRAETADQVDAFFRHSSRELVKGAELITKLASALEANDTELQESRRRNDLYKVAGFAVERGFVSASNLSAYVDHHMEVKSSPETLLQQMRDRSSGATFETPRGESKVAHVEDPAPDGRGNLSPSSEKAILSLLRTQ